MTPAWLERRRPRIADWLWQPILAARPIYAQIILASFIINLFGLAGALFSIAVFNLVIPAGAVASLTALAIGLVILLLFDFLLRTLRGYFIDIAGLRIDASISASLFERLLAIPMTEGGGHGQLASVLREYESIRDFFSSATVAALADLPFVLLFLLVIGLFGGWLVLVPLVLVLLVIGVGLAVQPRMRRLTEESMRLGHSKQGVLVETIAARETVQASGAGSFFTRRWTEAVSEQAEAGLQLRLTSALPVNLATVAQTLAYAGVLGIGALLVIDGRLSLGALIAASLLASRAVAPLVQIAALLARASQTRTAYAALDRIFDATQQPVEAHATSSPPVAGPIAVRNLAFRYPGSREAGLSGLDFQIAAGETVALVGPVGAGKTTLLRLLAGLLLPDEGMVEIGGADVSRLHPADRAAAIGVVLQEPVLFSGTVRENISLGDPALTDSAIAVAARESGADRIAGGLDRRVTDRGEGLSGGQRQAISLARAMVRNPPILLLDEPTSAMDAAAERAILAALGDRGSGRTLLIATHRLPLLQLADRILVMERGRIVKEGPRDAILAGLTRPARVAQ